MTGLSVLRVMGLAILSVTMPTPAAAQSELEQGLHGALFGCERWILEPASWAEGLDEFPATLGVGATAGWVPSVDDASMPPEELRIANHYLRINSTATAGYVLVVSDRLPFCHITGGGITDLQPVVEEVLASEEFGDRWQELEHQSHDGMISTAYRNRAAPELQIVISRAEAAGARTDRVQVIATAVYALPE